MGEVSPSLQPASGLPLPPLRAQSPPATPAWVSHGFDFANAKSLNGELKMEKYKTVRLGDVFDLQMGKTPDRKNLEYFQTNENKWISIADISKAEKYISETKECISDEAVAKSGIKQIPANTLIMSFKLSIGKTAITKETMYSNEAIMSFLPNGKYETSNDFLYHLFSNKDWSEGSNKAVKGITLNKASLQEAKISLPPLSEQNRIAAVLDKCTEVIAKHREMLSKYDALIKSRFIEMFGENPIENGKWSTKELSKVCTVTSSKRIYAEEQSNSGVPFLRISDLVSRINGSIENELFIPIEKFNTFKNDGLVPKTDDILITSRGTLGLCYIIRPDDNFYFQDGMITWLSFKNHEEILSIFLDYLFRTIIQKKRTTEKKKVYTLPLTGHVKLKGSVARQGSIYIHCGGDSIEDPPVPIPNTEVKLNYAGSTLLATAREIW